MKKYHIKISWHDRFYEENDSSLVELKDTENPLVCSFEQGKENLAAIQENIELEKNTSNVRTFDAKYELIKLHEDKRWFCFDKFLGLLKPDGKLDYAIDKTEQNRYEKKGRKVDLFYRPNFYNIKLLNESSEWVICGTFWHNNQHCHSYSAELVEIIPLEENLKITW
jgi:hypothetical protein